MIYLARKGFNEQFYLDPEKNVVSIGRHTKSDIQFTSTYVSRRHCEIKRIPPYGTLVIKNCSETNSTFVDDITLKNDKEAELRIGSLIGLGIPLQLANGSSLNDRQYVFLTVCQEEEEKTDQDDSEQNIEARAQNLVAENSSFKTRETLSKETIENHIEGAQNIEVEINSPSTESKLIKIKKEKNSPISSQNLQTKTASLNDSNWTSDELEIIEIKPKKEIAKNIKKEIKKENPDNSIYSSSSKFNYEIQISEKASDLLCLKNTKSSIESKEEVRFLGNNEDPTSTNLEKYLTTKNDSGNSSHSLRASKILNKNIGSLSVKEGEIEASETLKDSFINYEQLAHKKEESSSKCLIKLEKRSVNEGTLSHTEFQLDLNNDIELDLVKEVQFEAVPEVNILRTNIPKIKIEKQTRALDGFSDQLVSNLKEENPDFSGDDDCILLDPQISNRSQEEISSSPSSSLKVLGKTVCSNIISTSAELPAMQNSYIDNLDFGVKKYSSIDKCNINESVKRKHLENAPGAHPKRLKVCNIDNLKTEPNSEKDIIFQNLQSDCNASFKESEEVLSKIHNETESDQQLEQVPFSEMNEMYFTDLNTNTIATSKSVVAFKELKKEPAPKFSDKFGSHEVNFSKLDNSKQVNDVSHDFNHSSLVKLVKPCKVVLYKLSEAQLEKSEALLKYNNNNSPDGMDNMDDNMHHNVIENREVSNKTCRNHTDKFNGNEPDVHTENQESLTLPVKKKTIEDIFFKNGIISDSESENDMSSEIDNTEQSSINPELDKITHEKLGNKSISKCIPESAKPRYNDPFPKDIQVKNLDKYDPNSFEWSSKSCDSDEAPISHIKKEKSLSQDDDFIFKSNHMENKTENCSGLKIKIEPGLKSSSKSLSYMEDEDDDDIQVCYSQANDVILLSSDEEETSTAEKSLDASFGPLPLDDIDFDIFVKKESEPCKSRSKDKELDFDLDEEDFDFEFELPDLTDISSIKESKSNNSEVAEKKVVCSELGSKFNDGRVVEGENDDDDDDDWWPILSQDFFCEEKDDTEDSAKEADAKDNQESHLETVVEGINNRKAPKPKLLDPQEPQLSKKKRKNKSLKSEIAHQASRSLQTEEVVEDKGDDEDDWWPVLSQNFFQKEEESIQDNAKEPEVSKPGDSKDCRLESLIEKISNRKTSKSKLTEPQGPPPRMKRGRRRSHEIKCAIPSTSSLETDTKHLEIPKRDFKAPKPTSSKYVKSRNVVYTQVNSSKNRKKSSDLRKTLLKNHNLEAYKINQDKEKHHLVSKDEPTNRSQVKQSTNPSNIQKENISVQPKSKTLSDSVKKGIAKISRVSRNQKLTEINMFGPAKKKDKPFKIPKKANDAKNIKNVSETKSIIDKKEKANKSNEQHKQPSNENTLIDKINHSVSNNIPKVPILNSEGLKSILRLVPKHFTEVRQQVHFPPRDEDLTLVKLISPRKNKDCFGPASVQQSEIHFNKKKKNFKEQSNPKEFIHWLCNWNYDWFKTYKKMKELNYKNPTPPNLCKSDLLPTFITYNSLDEYKQTFSNMMYYELWEQLYRDWSQYVDTNTWFESEIDSVKIVKIGTLEFTSLKILSLITGEMSRTGQHPSTGSLIVFKCKINHQKGTAFGYVENIVKRRDSCIPQSLKNICPAGYDHIILYDVLCSKRNLPDIAKPGVFCILCNVSYIRPSIRAFESLCYLNASPLCPFILNPGDLSVFQSFENDENYLIQELELNESQKGAVVKISSKCVQEPHTPKLSLIHGPPGTGKTRVIIALISQIIKLFKETEYASNRRILFCAPSNAAVDELVIRLSKLKEVGILLNIVRFGVKQSFHPQVKEHTFDVRVKKAFDRSLIPNPQIQAELKRKQQLCHEAVEDFQRAKKENKSHDEVKKIEYRMRELVRAKEEFEKSSKVSLNPSQKAKILEECRKRVLLRAEVIATTLTSCLSGALFDVFSKTASPFCCCIVDEAGQCKESEIWFPLQLGIKKLVLVGDHFQLPATILSHISQGLNLHQSLFERLYHHIAIERRETNSVHTLHMQYRMHEEIVLWPSLRFYNSLLVTGPNVTREQIHALHPYLVFDVKCSGGEERQSNGDIFNLTEALLIQAILEAQHHNLKGLSIGVLTPYQRQKLLLIEKLDSLIKSLKITVSTIDNFQGQEKDVVFCSFVRSNPNGQIGFVSGRQRLNVALTRAKKSCFVIGDLSSLQTNEDWRYLNENAIKRKVIRRIDDINILKDKYTLRKMTEVDRKS